MTNAQIDGPSRQNPLRVWPGVVRRGAAVACQVRSAHRRARLHGHRGVRWRLRWSPGYRPVVGVLQPGAPVRSLERGGPDGRGAGRDLPFPPRVDCDRGARDAVLHVRHPGPVPGLRLLGGGRPPSSRRPPAGDDGRDHSAGERSVDAAAFRWRDRRLCRRVLVAVGGDAGGAAPGTSRSGPETPPVVAGSGPR